GGHHHDARINQLAHGAADSVVLVRIYSGRAETHVDDADVISAAVCEYGTARAKHRRGFPDTSRIRDSKSKQFRSGRHTAVRTRRRSNHRSHESSVTV